MGTQRLKWYCHEDDHVAKSAHAPLCPFCRKPMKGMGSKWRPGRRGTRTRMWDRRQSRTERLVGPWPYSWEIRGKIGRKSLRARREAGAVIPKHSGYSRMG